LGLLDQAATIEALTGPAAAAGRPMTAPAASTLAAASGGYPYAIQVLGHHAWRRSHGHQTITRVDADAAMLDAERDLADGLFRARWNDASDKEKDYLAALAGLLAAGHEPSGADVARTLGRSAQAVSYLRDRLLKKGTIYADNGALHLPVPGMASWIVTHRH
jgi:hypothetical protein